MRSAGSSLRRSLLRLLGLVVGLELLYLGLSYWLLSPLLRSLVTGTGFEVTRVRAHSLYPGHLHLAEISVRGESGHLRSLTLLGAEAKLSVADLFRRRLTVQALRGRELFLELEVPSAEQIASAEPPRQGLPQLSRAGFSTGRSSGAPGSWSLRVKHAFTPVREIRVGSYRLFGGMTLRVGGFSSGAGERAAHGHATLVLEASTLAREAIALLRAVAGRVELGTGRNAEGTTAGNRVGAPEARAMLRGTIPALGPVLALAGVAGRSEGRGEFDADVRVRAGGAWAGTIRAATDARISIGPAEAKSASIERGLRLLLERADSDELESRVNLTIPEVRWQGGSAAQLQPGIAGLSLESVRAARGVGAHEDRLRGTAERIDWSIAGLPVSAAGSLDLLFEPRRTGGTEIEAERGKIELRDIRAGHPMAGPPVAKNALLVVRRATLSLAGVKLLHGHLRVDGRDTAALFGISPRGDWLQQMFSGVAGQPFTFDAGFRKSSASLELDEIRVESRGFSVRGALHRSGPASHGAFLLRYGRMAVGLTLEDELLNAEFQVSPDWLRRRTERLP
jgi:hypothetical protein